MIGILTSLIAKLVLVFFIKVTSLVFCFAGIVHFVYSSVDGARSKLESSLRFFGAWSVLRFADVNVFVEHLYITWYWRRRFAIQANTEYIFPQLAVNVEQCLRLKIATNKLIQENKKEREFK